VVRHKRRWSIIYEGDVGSAGEWCQIKLHTSCDVPPPLNHLKTTVVDGARSIFAPTVVVIDKYFEFFFVLFLRNDKNTIARTSVLVVLATSS
jgi:hypothetical protein